MIAQCFYLVAFVTTMVSLTFSHVNLLPDGANYTLGSNTVRLANVKPRTVQTTMVSVNSTSTSLRFILPEPMVAEATSDVTFSGLSFTALPVAARIVGEVEVTKASNSTCATTAFVVSHCTMTVSASATVPVFGQLELGTGDFCDTATSVVSEVLTPKAYEPYPALTPGATRLSASTYMLKFLLVNAFAETTKMPVEAHFVAPNVLRLGIGSPVGYGLMFDSDYESDVETLDALNVLKRVVKKMLNVTVDPAKSNYTVVSFGKTGGTMLAPTMRHIVHKAIAEGAVAFLHSRAPRGSGLVYDVVVNDFKCRAFNTICSLPTQGGVEVVNSRFVGLGDLGSVLDHTVGSQVDALLRDVTYAAFRVVGSTFGDRIYLPIL